MKCFLIMKVRVHERSWIHAWFHEAKYQVTKQSCWVNHDYNTWNSTEYVMHECDWSVFHWDYFLSEARPLVYMNNADLMFYGLSRVKEILILERYLSFIQCCELHKSYFKTGTNENKNAWLDITKGKIFSKSANDLLLPQKKVCKLRYSAFCLNSWIMF